MSLVIYTDGASRGNPGPGGFGAILKWGSTEKELSAGYRLTTNNRMELLAVIEALNMLTREGLEIDIFSDSEYVVNSISKGWVLGWEKKGFAGKKNPDLWQRYLKVARNHHVKMHWVKGHASNVMNNRCDVLATRAADGSNLLKDEVYEHEYYNK